MRELSRMLWASSDAIWHSSISDCWVPGNWTVSKPMQHELWSLSQGSLLWSNRDYCQSHPLQWHVWWGHFPTQNSPIVSFWVCNRGLTSSAYDTKLSLLSLHLLLVFHPETEPWTHLCQSKLLGRKWQDWLSEKREYMVHVTVKISIY